ncbi:uncharacterized protein KZ484_010882 [Pholidichthys leucotaenia]
MEPRREDFSQQPECKVEEVLTEQQLWNQKRNSVLDQEEPEAPQVKEEQEELCISQEGEQLVVKLEVDPFMGTLVCEEKQQSEAEPNSEQLLSHNSAGTEIQDEEGSRHVDSGSTKEEEPKPKKRRLKTGSHSNSDDNSVTSETLCENETDAPQLHDCKEEEVLTVQQLWNQERNSSLDQEEQDAAQVKEEEQELCSSQEEEDFGLKQETDAFMVTPTDEDNDKSETEANSEQLLSHNSADTESQDQGSDAPQLHDCKEEEVLTVQQVWNQERNSSLGQEEQDAAQVKEEDELCSSQEEEDFGLKQETDSSMVTPTDEDNDKRETEANSEQLLSHNSADTESQDQGADKRLFSTSPSRRFLGLVVLSEEEKRAVLVQCHSDPGTGAHYGIRTTTDKVSHKDVTLPDRLNDFYARFEVGNGSINDEVQTPLSPSSSTEQVFQVIAAQHIKAQLPPELEPLQSAYRANRSTEDAISSALHLTR